MSVPLLPLLLFGLDWHPATELPAKQEGKPRRAADLGYLRSQGVLDARSSRARRILKAVGRRSDADRGGPLVRVVGSVEINRPAGQVWAHVADYGNDTSWRPVSARCTVAARIGPGRRHHPRHHPRGITAAGIELPHRRQHRPGRGRMPGHLAMPGSAEAAVRSSAGGADRPGQLPLHRGGRGPSARSVATSGAAGGVAAAPAGHRRPPTA
jgi:hypothetical protein